LKGDTRQNAGCPAHLPPPLLPPFGHLRSLTFDFPGTGQGARGSASTHAASYSLNGQGPPAGTEPGRLQGFPARAYLFEAKFALAVENGQL